MIYNIKDNVSSDVVAWAVGQTRLQALNAYHGGENLWLKPGWDYRYRDVWADEAEGTYAKATDDFLRTVAENFAIETGCLCILLKAEWSEDMCWDYLGEYLATRRRVAMIKLKVPGANIPVCVYFPANSELVEVRCRR